MVALNEVEVVIYIHGVSSDKHGHSHEAEYTSLHEGIAKLHSDWPSNKIGIEWGWNFQEDAHPKQHELLTDAQRLLGLRLMNAVDDPFDITINPFRAALPKIRNLIFYGFSDMFYYVSKDGKKAVRNTVATQIIEALNPYFSENMDSLLSLTILGHSAGSAVAFDLLFYLFFEGEHNFLVQCQTEEEKKLENALKSLREMAQTDNLRIRRLFTFGSPITALACRSDAILGTLASDDKLDATDYGLSVNPPNFDSRISGPRWINIWDKDDVIAWPVEPLMKSVGSQQVIKDINLDISDLISQTHNRYWSSSKVHELIADAW